MSETYAPTVAPSYGDDDKDNNNAEMVFGIILVVLLLCLVVYSIWACFHYGPKKCLCLTGAGCTKYLILLFVCLGYFLWWMIECLYEMFLQDLRRADEERERREAEEGV